MVFGITRKICIQHSQLDRTALDTFQFDQGKFGRENSIYWRQGIAHETVHTYRTEACTAQHAVPKATTALRLRRPERLSLLAWAQNGDAASTSDEVAALVHPAIAHCCSRFALQGRDYPEVAKHDSAASSMDEYLLVIKTSSQRKELEGFKDEA